MLLATVALSQIPPPSFGIAAPPTFLQLDAAPGYVDGRTPLTARDLAMQRMMGGWAGGLPQGGRHRHRRDGASHQRTPPEWAAAALARRAEPLRRRAARGRPRARARAGAGRGAARPHDLERAPPRPILPEAPAPARGDAAAGEPLPEAQGAAGARQRDESGVRVDARQAGWVPQPAGDGGAAATARAAAGAELSAMSVSIL